MGPLALEKPALKSKHHITGTTIILSRLAAESERRKNDVKLMNDITSVIHQVTCLTKSPNSNCLRMINTKPVWASIACFSFQ